MPTPAIDYIPHYAQPQPMAGNLLVQPGTAIQHLVTIAWRYARAVVIDHQPVTLGGLGNYQPDLGVASFAHVIHLVAEQLQQLFPVPRQLQTCRYLMAQLQMPTVDHVQRGEQPG